MQFVYEYAAVMHCHHLVLELFDTLDPTKNGVLNVNAFDYG